MTEFVAIGSIAAMGIQAFVRLVLPKENQFYDMLERLGAVAHESSVALLKLNDDPAHYKEISIAVDVLEKKGDRIVQEVEEALAKTFVTPIDREDIQKLSVEIDDIIDLSNLAARACVLFGLERTPEAMKQLVTILEQCSRIVKDAIPKLRAHKYIDLVEAGREVRALEKDADTVFRNALSSLYKDPSVDAKVFVRDKELLAGIENAVDRCDRVAGTLTNLAVKHG